MPAESVGQIGLDLVVNQKQFNNQMAGISSLAKKAGAMLAAAFAVKKVVNFGKACLDLGSDLNEVQNVVDVTFPNMTQKLNDFAKNAIMTSGLSETMAKRFTGTFGAMAKSFGFTEQQAYGMSTSLTALAGDVASFYNISQDAAYTKLKSVFTGETESLKDLGVVMTQTALDSYAMANGFGKTTQQMSEAEKVALRYSFVTSKLSAAQGDFARTSGSWANQVRILQLQVDGLKATIGQGLINLFTPIIRVVNTLLGKLATLANAFKSFTELITGNKSSGSSQISSMGDAAVAAGVGMDGAAESADNMAASNDKIGKSAKKAAKEMRSLMGFDKINKLDSTADDSDTGSGGVGSSSGAGASGLGNTVDFGKMADGENVIDKVDSKFQKMFENIKTMCEPAITSLKRLWNEGLARLGNFSVTALKDFLNNCLAPIGKWTLGTGLPRFIDALNNGLMNVNFSKINDSLNKLWAAVTPFAIHIGEGLLWFWENILVPLGTWTANEVVPRFLETLSIVIKGFDEILVALQPLFQWFWDNVLQPLAQWTGGMFLTAWDGINAALQKFSEWCAQHIPTVQELSDKFANFTTWLNENKTALEMIGIALAGFTAAVIANAVASNAHAIALGVESAAIAVYNGVTAIATTATGALSAAIGFLTSPITLAIAAITAIVAAGVLLYQNWDIVKEKCAQLKEWVIDKTRALKDGAVKAFNTLKENIGNAMKAIVESVQKKWEEAKELFGKFKEFLTGVFEKDWTTCFGSLGHVLNAFFKNVTNIWGDIKKIFNGVIEFINGVFHGNWKDAWEGIKDVFKGVFDGLVDLAKSPINAIIGGFNAMLGVVNGLIGKVNDIRFRITVPDWVPGFGGRGWVFNGFNIPSIKTIPPLAQGGFVRKNTPQLAMIGDNRHQGEVVAPEDKLRQMAMEAVQLAMKVNGAGSDAVTKTDFNQGIMRVIAAFSDMGFYVDGEQMAKANRAAQEVMDLRYNTVSFT